MANKSMGQFIAALRKANGMTQQEVADRLNVSNKAVSRWERNECSPDLSLIPALAEMFQVTCDELLKGERILESSPIDKKEIKVEKQLKTIVNRALSNFKTMIWISLALSLVGLVCMFGISYGFYRPIIGFAVMFLFEIAAVVTAAIATNRMKEIKTDNELFENADNSLLNKFNKSLGSLSFTAFFVSLSVILSSAPLAVKFDSYVESVLTFKSYILNFLWLIVLALIFIYYMAKDKYVTWITGQPTISKDHMPNPNNVKRMTLIQVGAVILAGLALFIQPYFETNPYQSTLPYGLVTYFAITLLSTNIICFIGFMIKCKFDRKQLLLPGIRNMLFIISAFLIGTVHNVGFIIYDDVNTNTNSAPNTSWEKYENWNYERLLLSIGFALLVFIIFKALEKIVAKRKS